MAMESGQSETVTRKAMPSNAIFCAIETPWEIM
jgi:hypothetical protein